MRDTKGGGFGCPLVVLSIQLHETISFSFLPLCAVGALVNNHLMSLYDYKNNTLVKRVDTIQVTTGDFIDIITSNDLNRVQKVLAIRDAVRDSYTGYRDVTVRFVDGVIENLIDSSKLEGRPLPSILLFEVELHMPLVEASNVPVGLKRNAPGGASEPYTSYGRSYKQESKDSIPPTWRKDNDHIYWS